MPLLLKMSFDYVDVRDVALLHLLAMTNPKAKGQRFIATSGENLSFKEVALILKQNLGKKAAKVSTREVPSLIDKVLALFVKAWRMPATFIGQDTACSNGQAKKILGWQPRSAEVSILATAESMIELGIVE